MGRRDRYSGPVAARLAELGFGRDFAAAISSLTDTEYTSKRMLSYLKNSLPLTGEEVADEALIILQERDRYREKHIREGRRREKPVEELFVRGFEIDWKYLEGNAGADSEYVLEIPALRSLETFSFRRNLTFFCGENGSGKSTLLEGLAVALGLNPEGGTGNYLFSTYDDWSALGSAMRLSRGPRRPDRSYFLRAESFYNMASAALREYNHDGRMPDYHARSHGESFLDFITDNRSTGLYLMDEPEAALSPQKQLELLVWLARMSRAGSQFVIATHSPILLGTPDADILCFDGTVHPVSWEETESYQITKLFVDGRERLLKELLREDG